MGRGGIHLKQRNFLPRLLESRAEGLLQIEDESDDEIVARFDLAIRSIEDNLRRYALDFPLFSKIDGWKSPHQEEASEIWILERIGWGKWKRKNRLLYVVESIRIPVMPDAEVLSVNSNSPPYLQSATELDWESEIHPDEIQAIALDKAPPLLKEKAYPYLPEFLFFLSETLEQMAEHHQEFESFMEEKVEEFVQTSEKTRDRGKRSQIAAYFQTERKAELFLEFLQNKNSEKSQ